MRVLDMYCGMGGFSLGFALAGLRPIEGHDIWPRAVATYNLNLRRLGCRAEVSDLTKRTPKGDFDVVIGGPPCQPFSRANVGARGEEHPLWPTFPAFFTIVLEKEPLVFLMENVPGLAYSHKDLLEEQLRRVKPYYRLKVAILNAADYGVPQRRRRLLVLGVRKDLGVRPSFPPPSHARNPNATITGHHLARWVSVYEAIGDIMTRPGALPEHEYAPVTDHDWQYGFEPIPLDRPSKTITTLVRCAKRTTNGAFRTTVLIMPANTLNTKGFLAPPGHHTTFCGRNEPETIRKLTVRECLRLQGFPDWWRFPHGIPITAKYILVGEAVPPILAYRLGVHVARLLGVEPRVPPREGEWALPYFRRAFHDLLGGGGP